jgi:hypothetical protein
MVGDKVCFCGLVFRIPLSRKIMERKKQTLEGDEN